MRDSEATGFPWAGCLGPKLPPWGPGGPAPTPGSQAQLKLTAPWFQEPSGQNKAVRGASPKVSPPAGSLP